MNKKTVLVLLLASVALAGCRGADETDIIDPQFPVTNDPDAFAQFLNPLPGVPDRTLLDGEIDNVKDFPEAYYNTIDPDDTRDTLLKWRIGNGFANADGTPAACDNPATCIEANVKFRDTKDLGYGRNMFMRRNLVSGDVAIFVENFQVNSVPGVPYGPLNFEALSSDDRQWNFGVNAIEFSAFPGNSRKFTKFYNFAGDGNRTNDVSGTQQHFVDLDTRGDKPMPTTCIVCHGGRGEALVYREGDGDEAVLKVAPTLIGGVPGDVQAQLQTIEFDTLDFGGQNSEENERNIRLINEAILSAYEYRRDNFSDSDNNLSGNWDATLAIETLRGRYAGDLSELAANPYDSSFVPVEWSSNQDLYRSLVGPNCMVCHALRGTISNTSVGFPSFNEFRTYDERIDHLIYEQGKMPLGLLNYSDFWDSTDKDPATMALALQLGNRVDANQRAIRPGAPVAVISAPPLATGLDASGGSVDIAITGSGSAFATASGHRWTVSPEGSATVTPAGVVGDAVLRVSVAGDYTLNLTVDGVNGGSATTTQVMRVVGADDPQSPPLGADIRFFGPAGTGTINELISNNGCASCHAPGTGYPSMPIHYTACQSDDYDGNEFLYRTVLARVNFESPLDSLFLRKPSQGATDSVNRTDTEIAGYHAGGSLLNESDYSSVLSWILNGAPSGDIAAVAAPTTDCEF